MSRGEGRAAVLVARANEDGNATQVDRMDPPDASGMPSNRHPSGTSRDRIPPQWIWLKRAEGAGGTTASPAEGSTMGRLARQQTGGEVEPSVAPCTPADIVWRAAAIMTAAADEMRPTLIRHDGLAAPLSGGPRLQRFEEPCHLAGKGAALVVLVSPAMLVSVTAAREEARKVISRLANQDPGAASRCRRSASGTFSSGDVTLL
jgi:hypothetical protein